MIHDDRTTLDAMERNGATFDPAQYIPVQRGSFLFGQPLQQENDARVHPRQPNLGYAAMAVGIGFVLMLLATTVVLSVGSALHLGPSLAHLVPAQVPKETILGEALGYGLALAVLIPLFRAMWRRPFAAVLHMNFGAVRVHVGKLVVFGVALSLLAQAAESVLTLPKEIPMDAFFRTPADIWVVALFGTLIAPPIEELLFRGFLLPAFAIAFDWVRLPRTDQALASWTDTDKLSRTGLIFSGVLTSLLFGAMHAGQLGFAWNAVALLSCVGGVLTIVRLRFDSVWASSVVHMVYNGFIFAILFVATDGFRHLDKLHNH